MKSGKCCWIHVAFAIIGILFYLVAFIRLFFLPDCFVNHPMSLVIVGNSFLLIAIASKLLCKCNCCCKDDKCDTETK